MEIQFKADLVLHDCMFAISKHSESLQGTEFRLSWWTIISLLRAIGHVLHKVDSTISEKHKFIIDEEFTILKKSRPKPEIYWEFIEIERNQFLKNYDYGVRRQFTNSWKREDGKIASLSVYVDDQLGGRITPALEGIYQESFIKYGHFKGQNERDLVEKAIAWWHYYINNIKYRIRIT
jgi:hypothetical protein